MSFKPQAALRVQGVLASKAYCMATAGHVAGNGRLPF